MLSSLYRDTVTRGLDAELEVVVQTLLAAVSSDEDGTIVVVASDLPNDPRFARVLSGRYWAMAPRATYSNPESAYRSRSLFEGNLPWPADRLEELTRPIGAMRTTDARGPNDEQLRVLAMMILLPDREDPVVLVAGIDRRDAEQALRQFNATLAAALAILAAGLVLAMVIQVRVGLAPLGRISVDLADIRAGRRTKIADNYPREIKPLADELNQMLEHNREVVDRARTHVGNLAHALKTPIAVLMNESGGQGEFSDLVRRQADTMSRNVNHYLKRAQAAATAQVLSARCEVKPVLDDLARMLTRLFQAKGVDITVTAPAGLAFRGERHDLEEMVGNLMENACKWCLELIEVTVTSDGSGHLRVEVGDDGPGLAPSAREKAIKRGARLDEATPGTGLGLSIVSDLAQDYGGGLSLGQSPLGGLLATLSLPQAAE